MAYDPLLIGPSSLWPIHSDANLIGFTAIEGVIQARPVQPLRSTCKLGPRMESISKDGFTVANYTVQYAPEPTLAGHFEFGLKYEPINLEWMARLFRAVEPSWIEDWLKAKPNSIYARKAAFFYEWTTGATLRAPPITVSSYELALDPSKILCASSATRGALSKKWKIDDNLPGTPDWCPLIHVTQDLKSAVYFNLAEELALLDQKFGADLLMRSAAWLTFNESKASFTIEKEADRTSDIQRFANAMSVYCGKLDDPLSGQGLAVLQGQVLGKRALRTGIRQSPVFVGSTSLHGTTVVKYVAPHFSQIDALLAGLKAFEERTRLTEVQPGQGLTPEQVSTVRACAISFGFVYIHPMSDGNGRIHRLLINDVLLRDKQIPPGIIVPISSTITKSSKRRGDYDAVLDSISRRQIGRFNSSRIGRLVRYADGVESDFHFDDYEEASISWRFPDLTDHVEYMAQIISATVRENMTEEAAYLFRYEQALGRLKQVMEMPDQDASRIVRSLNENHGRVSNVLREKYVEIFGEQGGPLTSDGEEAVEAVMSALSDREWAPGQRLRDDLAELNKVGMSDRPGVA